MSERPLLLSSAKIGVLKEEPRLTLSIILSVTLGALLVLFGAADIVSRLMGYGGLNTPQPARASESQTTHLVEVLSRPQADSVTEAFVPTQLVITKLGIHAAVESVGLNARGNMAVPSGYSTVAWYKDGAMPGTAGNTVIAGHLNNSLGLAGVFEKLNTLELGDTVEVVGNGETARYVVREMTVYDADDAPTAQIFSTTGPQLLLLITCDGAWDHGKRSYDKRLIVVAEPVSSY